MIRHLLVTRCVIVPMLALIAVVGTAFASEAKVSFRVPAREYQQQPGLFNVYVERSLTEGDGKLAAAANQKLAASLNELFALLPQGPARQLQDLRFYLMWGEKAPHGGRRSGMSYIRPGEPRNHPHLDPDWDHVIVIYSADNLMYLDALWTRKALLHELAHAWHIMNWPEKHPPIMAAYRAAKTAGLYLRVKDNKGKLVTEAYAARNPLEYFAELSAMYFVGGNYFPFDRAGVVRYDPAGAAMVSDLWSSD